MSAPLKACIIGSGVAGMACAIRLAVQGFNVSVFEKNSYPGGKLSAFEKDGFHFDAGPSLFVQPENIEALFKLAGENIQQYLRYNQLDITCKYFYEDGVVISAWTNKEKFANEIEAKTGEPAEHVLAYLKESEKIYRNIGDIFLNNPLQKTATWLKPKIIKALGFTKPGYLFSTFNKLNEKKFSNPHIVQLFNRYATYNGSDPYQAPGMLQLIPHIEFNEGVFYPLGGMISVTKALYSLALKKGVQFYFNAPVQEIIKEGKSVKGIIANGKDLYADVVVSNADVYFTYKQLLNKESIAKQILKQESSSSAIVFYWGIKKEFQQLNLHNVFFSNNYKEEFNSIFKTKTVYADPTVYINITSKCEPGVHAPAGKENWFVMVNVASDVHMSEATAINTYRKNIITKLNRILQINIESLIETEAILHPRKIEEETASYAGAIYGTSSNSRKAAFLRHPNFSDTFQGLYFTGGSVHPGGGIPLCLKSAEITSRIIDGDVSKQKPDA